MGKNARTFGQDLMRGEHVLGRQAGRMKTNRLAPGATGKNTAWLGSDSRRLRANTSSSAMEYVGGYEDSAPGTSGTSIFDPVLCELVYRWFCPSAGAILDPFAGGSVRGIVAAKLGYRYTGIDLSARQIEANNEQAAQICNGTRPKWIVGDSRDVDKLADGKYDLVFSCPPYGNLEEYSDDPRDLSTLEQSEFIAAYRQIIARCVAMLQPNRFACFIVGDYRDKKGFYANFVSQTIAAFQNCGLPLYNEAILVTAVGSLPIRVGKQFGGYRKLGKTHQNVLVFYRGDIKAIKTDFGDCDFGSADLSAPEMVSCA